jgi:hypothetical protein
LWLLTAVVASLLWILIPPTPNPKGIENHSSSHVKELINQGVEFFFCENTAYSLNASQEQIIEEIEFINAGVTAVLIDLQLTIQLCTEILHHTYYE